MLALIYRLFMQYEKYDVIYTHYPGPCKQLLGKGKYSKPM